MQFCLEVSATPNLVMGSLMGSVVGSLMGSLMGLLGFQLDFPNDQCRIFTTLTNGEKLWFP